LVRIPPEILKASIKPGSVYYFHEESIKSQEKHYFVIINKNPSTDEVLLLACASSKIEKVKHFRKYCPPETIVIISPEQYSDFSVISVLDCNYVFTKRIYSLMKKYTNKELLVKTEMDISLVELLRKGVLASNLIPKRIKSFLR
jgi:hypothetical protein